MSHLIIILDEADKMFEDADDRHYSYIVQNELLKVLEGTWFILMAIRRTVNQLLI